MELTKNILHKFDLTGAKAGDWFLGCIKCNYRLELNQAACRSLCPNCGTGIHKVYTVTQGDVS